MATPSIYEFTRYLAAKKSVDDRALNRRVWQTLAEHIPPAARKIPLQVLEVGAGIGTMLERMLDWGLLGYADYTGIEAQAENIAEAGGRLPRWAREQGFRVESRPPCEFILTRPGQRVSVHLEAIDLFDFAAQPHNQGRWDLLAAHAFLDLMDIPAALPILLNLLQPRGLYYFSLNFDGATLLEPEIDAALDERIQALYHQSMDERFTGGRPSGDSRAGRRLFAALRQFGAQILDAGASDWVVYPTAEGYVQDEAYFLHFIIHTIQQALAGHPQIDPAQLAEWTARRHAQVERCELVYIAHQLDFIGIRE